MYQCIYRKPKPIIVDTVEFPSITYASKALGVSQPVLFSALQKGLFRGKIIRYKYESDIPQSIRAFPQQPKPIVESEQKNNKARRIEVDGIMYNAFTEAAKKIGVTPEAISYALRSNRTECNGHTLKVIDKPLNRGSGRPTIAIEIDNKRFPSIVMAGQYYNMDSSMISHALLHSKDRTFRGMPIHYADAKLEEETVKRLNGITKETKEDTVPQAVIKEEPKPTIQQQPKQTKIDLAVEVLKEKTIDYINNNNYLLAKDLIAVIEQLTI